MAVHYDSFDGARVSGRWKTVLTRARKDGIRFHVNSGHRTMAEQQALFNRNMHLVNGRWVPRPGHPLTAVPNRDAPHIFTGRAAHALDVDSNDGGETRLQRWLEKQGTHPTNPVPGESWHMVLSGRELDRLYRRFKPSTNDVLAQRAKAHGANFSLRIVIEAKRAGLPASLGFALIEQESNFRNVFGHDPTIFAGAGTVTAAKYRAYKQRRGPTGRGGMQGVGPAQLTWWEFQDAADRLGGCHIARFNIQCAFAHLAALIKQHGRTEGIRRYNGSGPAAVAYEESVSRKAKAWHERLS